MRFTKYLSAVASSIILASAALATGSLVLNPSFAGESRPAAISTERTWLSIGQVYQKLEAAGFRNVEEIEREDGFYEARATDGGGMRVKVYVNPQTGEIVNRRQDRRERDDDEASSDGRQRGENSADCNKRRCRDDLPTNAAAPAPAVR